MACNDSKPRSFEDEQHQESLNTYKNTPKNKLYKELQSQSYSHYKTFHAGEPHYNYPPLGHVFRNRSFNNAPSANSSPDLNNQLQQLQQQQLMLASGGGGSGIGRPYYSHHYYQHLHSHCHHHGHHHHRKSFSVIYQDIMKVRYIRPLETLHNNLCFRVLNDFLIRMINDKQDESSAAAAAVSNKSDKKELVINKNTKNDAE